MTTSSPERMAANRANAQKSTGPRTNEGKAASKFNAVKHGILSREVLVAGENTEELTALHEWFQDDLKPVGPMEVMLVNQIVTNHWRLRRVLAAESGEIALSMDEGVQKRTRRAELEKQCVQWALQGNPLPLMEASAVGCSLLQSWLRDVVSAVDREGVLSEAAVLQFSRHFGHNANGLVDALWEIHRKLREKPGNLELAAWKAQNKPAALEYLKENIELLAMQEAQCQEQESPEETARQAAAVLPSAEVLQKIIRYESMLNRQLHRAMKELRTLQKERREAAKLPNEAKASFALTPALSRPTGEGEDEHVSRHDQAKPSSDASGSLAHRTGEGQGEGSPKLPNEPIALGTPVQSSEFKVQSSPELRNEPIAPSAVQGSEFKV
jgi:hypothetical protein